MLTQICQYLRNWFDKKPDGTSYPKYGGDFTITEGEIDLELATGTYIRIIGSLFNDGVHRYGDGGLTDEAFEGDVWVMSIPKTVRDAATWAESWVELNGGADSAANSPFTSESFGGYSYSKGANSNGTNGASVFDQSYLINVLAPWRKI